MLILVDRAFLDLDPDPVLCLDPDPRRQRPAAAYRRARFWPAPFHQHAVRGAWSASSTATFRSWCSRSMWRWKSSTGAFWKPRATLAARLGAHSFRSRCRCRWPAWRRARMLVFILLMGEFLIPQLLGGGKVFFVGNALVDLFLQSRNWPYGAAIAATLVIVMLVTVTLYLRSLRRLSGGARRRGIDVGDADATLCSCDLPLPLHSDRGHCAFFVQCRSPCGTVHRLFPAMVRQDAGQSVCDRRGQDQLHRGHYLGAARHRLRHAGGGCPAGRARPDAPAIRRADLCGGDGAGHCHRHRHADCAGDGVRHAQSVSCKHCSGRRIRSNLVSARGR